MLSYRSFRNTDPPLIATLWRSRQGQPGMFQPMSVDVLEQFVFAKLYFDYRGLWLAFDAGRPVGFAHAGFGPNPSQRGISAELGVICAVVVRPDCGIPEQEIASGLLEQCEAYLRERGAKVVFGGAAEPAIPFYWGLYGGTRPPGVLHSDQVAQDLYRTHGYREVDRTLILTRELATFRPVVDRQQMLYRRQMALEMKIDPPSRTWWEASTTADFDLTRFEVGPRGTPSPLVTAVVRNLEPGTAGCPGMAVGLLDLAVDPGHRRQGLATFLLSEAFRQLARQGFAAVEAQVRASDLPGVALFRKLGFVDADSATLFRKDS